MRVDLPPDWRRVLEGELGAPYFHELCRFVDDERAKAPVYPAEENVFRAFRETPFAEVRVVLLGQDPYHGEGQAHGLCFSVPEGARLPPSLRNMLKELESDTGTRAAASGDLSTWARRGVLLLNTVLTVRAGQAASHAGRGWERFTDAVIDALNARDRPLVFALWGKPAEKKARRIDGARHRVVTAAHPSPLSAHRGFLGARPYSAIQEALRSLGEPQLDLSL
jgi:uracil-DNA glycosylase